MAFKFKKTVYGKKNFQIFKKFFCSP